MPEKVRVNQSYRVALVLFILILLLYEIYSLIFVEWTYWGVIPLTLQSVVLSCLFSRSRYLKMVVKIWTGIIIFGCSLQVLGAILRILGGDYAHIRLTEQLQNVIMLTVFLALYTGSNKYIIGQESQVEVIE